MAGTLIAHGEGEPWETWDDPALAARSPLRWRLIFSGRRTPTGALSMGLAEFPPGAVLPLHHHAPAEIYHVLEGEGLAEVEGEPHRLRAGASLFIPAGARHRTTNTGPGPLRFLFVFPTDSFEEVVYHFDE
jgi:quercetin dioxygenase-like cupin family protein